MQVQDCQKCKESKMEYLVLLMRIGSQEPERGLDSRKNERVCRESWDTYKAETRSGRKQSPPRVRQLPKVSVHLMWAHPRIGEPASALRTIFVSVGETTLPLARTGLKHKRMRGEEPASHLHPFKMSCRARNKAPT